MSRLLTRSFVSIVLAQATFAFAFASFFLLPKYLTVELGVGAREIGLVALPFGIASFIFIPLVGTWVDRFRRRPFVIAGACIMSVASLAFLAVDSVGPLIFALRAIQGVAFALVFISCSTLVSDEAPPDRLGQALGLFGLSFLSMHAVSPALCEAIVDAAGWKPTFVLASVMAAVSALLSLGIREPAARDHGDVPVPSLWAVASRPRSLRFSLVIALCGAGFGTMLTYHQPFALERGITHLRGFFIAYALAGVAVRLCLGGLADRLGRYRVALGSFIVYGAVIFAMAYLEPGRLVALGIVFGLAHGLFYPAFNALAVEAAADNERGKVMALFNGSFNLGFTLAVLSLGFWADRFGYPSVFYLAAAATGLGVLVLLRFPERRTAKAEYPLGADGEEAVPQA